MADDWKNEDASQQADPSVWNPSANLVRNIDLELVFYGKEQCIPSKAVGPAAKGHYKVHYVHSGCGKIWINDRVIPVHKGQCFVFYPDDYVYYKADDKDPWHYSWVAFDGANAEYYLKRANIKQGQILVEKCNQEILEDSFTRLLQVDMDDPVRDMKFISLLYNVLSALQVDADAKETLHNMRYPYLYVKKAIKYIQENYDKNISVTEIADYLSLERKYFSRIFKDHLNASPNSYIANYRFMKACELLESTPMNVAQIAEKVGYDNPFSFSRAFKKQKGMSPSRYREQQADEKGE